MKYVTKRSGIRKIVDWSYCSLGAVMYALAGVAMILLLVMSPVGLFLKAVFGSIYLFAYIMLGIALFYLG